VRGALLLLAALLPLAAACGSGVTDQGVVSGGRLQGAVSVFAAASLTESFTALGKSFVERNPGVSVQPNFNGTPTLVTQIEEGAPADVFASADVANMDKLRSDGFTAGTPRVFAHNRLEIVVAAGNPKHINGPADLARPGLIYIAAAANVPAGKYAQQALAKAGVTVTPRSLEADVKSVVSKVELGEADAGIVYATDVRSAGKKVDGVAIPDADNVVATYPIVTVKGLNNAEAADAFIAYLLSATGQATLKSYGFLPA
jgi:molybdate transport system substrate-binding protein